MRKKSFSTTCFTSRTRPSVWTSSSCSKPSKLCCWDGVRSEMGILVRGRGHRLHLRWLPRMVEVAQPLASNAGAVAASATVCLDCDGGSQRRPKTTEQTQQLVGTGLSAATDGAGGGFRWVDRWYRSDSARVCTSTASAGGLEPVAPRKSIRSE